MSAIDLKNPLILALDVDSLEQARRLSALLAPKIGAVKVGPRLAVRYGAALISELAKLLPVFVDNKYLDIPNTMESAIRATFDAGASLATVHAWAGAEALTRLAAVERELNQQRPFKILVVTILTSFGEASLPPGMVAKPIASHVDDLASLAVASGLSGLVCSPHEVAHLRAHLPDAYLVTPGVRLSDQTFTGDGADDQKRVESPASALAKGASALVIGRPIYGARDPLAATEQILATLAKDLSV